MITMLHDPDNMPAANQNIDSSHEEMIFRRRYGLNWTTMLKSLVFLIPVLIGIAIFQRGHIPNVITSRDTGPGPPSSSPTCANPPLNNCSFYADCLESRYHCGPSGYPIGYGQKYCMKFSDNRLLFDSHGQQWMENTMHCLQMALVTGAIGTPTTCQALEDQAFATHAGCYVDNGLCTLGIHDWSVILEIVDIKTLFASWDAFIATVGAVAGCAEFYAFMVTKGLF